EKRNHGKSLDLSGDRVGVVARLGAVRNTTAYPDRRLLGTRSCTTCTLLLPGLLVAACYFTSCLCTVRTNSRIGELVSNCMVNGTLADFPVKYSVVKLYSPQVLSLA